MKKLRFAIQLAVLAAAFPVLFIAGIRGPKTNTGKEEQKKTKPVVIKKYNEVDNVTLHLYGVITPRI